MQGRFLRGLYIQTLLRLNEAIHAALDRKVEQRSQTKDQKNGNAEKPIW